MHDDPRDAFDAASIAGMRDRLAGIYASFRSAEARANRERSPSSAGGTVGTYHERHCPFCGATPPAGPPLVGAHGLSIVECPACRFVYSKTVMEQGSDRDRYRESEIDAVTIQLRDSEPYLALETARSNYYLDRIAAVGRRAGTLLEIGCGSGTFLVEAARRGWDAIGIEPGRAATEHARSRGARVTPGYFPQDLDEPARRYDVIAILDVLEHIVEPRPFLTLIRERLSPGGLMFVQVPNWESLLVQIEGANSTIVGPGHWSYFTARSLSGLLQSEAFSTLHCETVVSELDRIAAHGEELIGATLKRLRPDACLPHPIRPSDLYRHDLGYKLIGIFGHS